jgi:predicted  nucleic acid-binding Zn-ribbon protein
MRWMAIVLLLLLKTAVAQDSLTAKAVKQALPAKAQTVKKKAAGIEAKPVPVTERRVSLSDSIIVLQEQLLRQRDSFDKTLQQKDDELGQLQSELSRRKEQIRNYESELSDLRGDNLQSSHTNSILFIFNIVVGILLVVSLGWMYLRKRSEPGLNTHRRWNSQEAGEPSFDHRLDRIQKLGSLRDRGLLTEEEFNLQKRQILGE